MNALRSRPSPPSAIINLGPWRDKVRTWLTLEDTSCFSARVDALVQRNPSLSTMLANR